MKHTFDLRGIVDFNLREPLLSELASSLVSNNCFASRDHADWLLTPPEISETVDALARRQLIERFDAQGRTYIALSEHCAANGLHRVWKLANPHSALEPRLDIPLEDKTSYELITALRENGWSWTKVC